MQKPSIADTVLSHLDQNKTILNAARESIRITAAYAGHLHDGAVELGAKSSITATATASTAVRKAAARAASAIDKLDAAARAIESFHQRTPTPTPSGAGTEDTPTVPGTGSRD